MSDAALIVGALMPKITNIENSLYMVKSVQRGKTALTVSATTQTVSISTINPNKSFVVLTGNADASINPIILQSLASDNFVITSVNGGGFVGTRYCSWQVIEFY